MSRQGWPFECWSSSWGNLRSGAWRRELAWPGLDRREAPAGDEPRTALKPSTLRLAAFIPLCLLVIGAAVGIALADPPRVTNRPTTTTPAVEPLSRAPSPLEDDAQLHDVQFVSSQLGWAVGDHGVIWHTRDGGEHWELQTSGVRCTLSSICFLTNRVGWAAGGGTMPFTRVSTGVLLHTIDGGKTWRSLVATPLNKANSKSRAVPARSDESPSDIRGPENSAAKSTRPAAATPTNEVFLPRLTRVKFFSLLEGFAVGQGTDEQPSGVFFTEDGGMTWRHVPGQSSPGWLAADFVDSATGVVAGPRGRIALVSGQQVTAAREGSLGRRGLRDVALQGGRSGWLVGDGGRVLRTRNAGLVWESPPAPLPEGIRDTFDFRAVFCRGKNVWVGGQPGSAIWHTADGGASWKMQSTGQSVPITAIHFSSDEEGCAVGALGMILRTEDGGRTWNAVRGGQRRLAVMFVQGDRSLVSLMPIADVSGESGYRSLVSVVAGEDAQGAGPAQAEFEARLVEAVTLAGGSAAHVDWQLALDIPGLERDSERLVAEWNRRTEGRLEEVLIGGFVRQLRTWRPSVMVLEQPATSDALTRLINQAALKAREQAEDSTQFSRQRELAGLEAWRVARVFRHLPPGSAGHVQIDPHRYLPHLQDTPYGVAARAESLLFESTAASPARDTYRLDRSAWDEKQGATIPGGFFAGLALGADARRTLPPIDDDELEARQKLANRQRVFAAHAERSFDDPRQAGQLVAQLSQTVKGMPEPQAALLLADLAERYHRHGHWELAELAMVELVEKYPNEPAALRAMQQLVQYWASAEITWRRLKQSSSQQQRDRSDPSGTAQAITQVEARLEKLARDQQRTPFDLIESEQAVDPIQPAGSAVTTAGYTYRNDLERKLRFWQAEGVRMARNLEQRAPQLAAIPEVQFPLAAVYRQHGVFAKSDDIYRRFLQRDAASLWSRPAEAEFWLTHPQAPLEGPVVGCQDAMQRPQLDGILSDRCWQDSEEMLLLGADRISDRGGRSLAMVCRDGEYLFLAASVPRMAGVRTDGPTGRKRRYDENLTDFDRVTFFLDVDRDRVTYFAFSIDQRGCTSESCCHDRTWNPRGWVVAVDADETHWRMEAAIPLSELTPRPPERGAAWGVGVVRTVPAVGWQSWTQPAGEKPRPETFGLVRFD